MSDERKRSGDKRIAKERRSGKDTREEEKRLTGERRTQADRRSGQDRRVKRSDSPKTK